MSERYAIYYAPATDDPLWQRAAEWLGRDPAGTSSARWGNANGMKRERLDTVTASARRYGFHATLRAPFRLREGLTRNDLEVALRSFAASHRPVQLGMLEIASLDGFVALVPKPQPVPVTVFAAAVVEDFEPLRAPLTQAERARRTSGGRLTERQIELVDAFGYPYVLEQFQFHMTLTDRLSSQDLEPVMTMARQVFSDEMGTPRLIDRLVLFHEAEPGAPFTRLGDYMLEGWPPR